MKVFLLLVVSGLLFNSNVFSQVIKQVLYKQVDTTELYMDVYFPDTLDTKTAYPAIVFFFGGGWNQGSTAQFEQHAKYFSNRGMICFLVNYRVKSRHQTSPFESLKDAKSAMRYIRKNASGFNVNPAKIIASGGSAGGHLAAATALIHEYNEESDDMSVSCVPNALVLFNPVIDNGPGGYGYERVGDKYRTFSPIHNIVKDAPPTIIFLGTEDKLIPVETVRYYKVVMEKTGSRCELVLYEEEGHGFFNYGRNLNNYKSTVIETDIFLKSLGYLQGGPIISKQLE